MDKEKAFSYAGNYSNELAVEKALDEWKAERQAQEEIEWAEKPLYEKVYEKASDVASDVANTAVDLGTAAFNTVGAVAQDVYNAYNELGQRRADFMHKGAEIQAAALQGQETGDYSGLNEAVDNLRQAGRDYNVSIANFAVSPTRQAARAFINSKAGDNSSPWQGLAQDLEKSDVAQEYFTTDAEKTQKAREMEAATGIPADAILSSNETYKAALDIYNLKQKVEDIDKVWETYPELKAIASMDKNAAALCLHDIQTVRQSHSIVDLFKTFLEKGNKELEYNNLQYEIMNGRASDEDKRRAEELKKELDRDKRQAPSVFDSPLEAAAAEVGQSLPEMWQGIKETTATDIAITTLAVAATVLSGGTDLLVAGGVAGMRQILARTLAKTSTKKLLEAGTYYGMAHGIGAPESGSRYAAFGEEKTKDGKPLYTEEERVRYALIGGYGNALLEVMPTLGVAKNAIFPVAEKVLAQTTGQILRNATRKETMRDFAATQMGNWLKMTATESAEESAQTAADDLLSNYARLSKGEDASHLKIYSAAEILNRAAVAFIESLPASAVFSTVGAGASTITGAGRISRANKRAAEMERVYGQQQAKTMMGAMAVEQLQKTVKDGNLNKVAPDVQKKVIREQLQGSGFETAYIDIEMAMQKDNGREDLKKVAAAQGLSAEDLETAITSNGYLSVPTETLAQVETTPDLLDSVSFTPEAESMARMRENGKKIVEEYKKNMEKAVERQLKLADTIVNNYIPADSLEERAEMRKTLKAVMLQNLQNPAQGWNELYKNYNGELQEKIAPALEALKRGMGNAGIMEVEDEQGNKKTQRYSENDEWYRNFYKANKRKPTAEELQDMAIAMTVGDPSAPKVAGWVPENAETQAAMEQERETIENLQRNINLLNSVKNEAKKMTGVEMELTEGLTPEGFKVYRAISSWTEKAGGKIARAGRMTALLWARHADIVADIITKKTGQKYTAEDYIRKHLLLELVKDGQFGEGLNQTQGELAEEKLKRDMEAWKETLNEAWKGPGEEKEMLRVMETPLVLQLVGARYLPMYIKRNKLQDIKDEHPEIKKAVLNKLPQYMTDPIYIFKSKTVEGRLVLVLDLKGFEEDKNIIVPVELDARKGRTEVNILTSVYGKDDLRTWFVDNVYKGNTVYINKEKALNLHQSAGLQLPLEGERFNDLFGSSIKTEADLVKMKNENPGLYQLAGVRATNAPLEVLESAKEMLSDGDDMDTIFKETGWLQGADGKWRFEIPDNLDKIHWEEVKGGKVKYSLSRVYNNERLYEAYPWLSDIPVGLSDMAPGHNGRVAGDVYRYIEINSNIPDEEKSKTLIHEIQHLIQEYEGFAVGGNMQQVRQQIQGQIESLRRKLAGIPQAEEYIRVNNEFFTAIESGSQESLDKAWEAQARMEEEIPESTRTEIDSISLHLNNLEKALQEENDDYRLYLNLAGEQEARETAFRAKYMTEYKRAFQDQVKAQLAYEKEVKKQPLEMLEKLRELQHLENKIGNGITDEENARAEQLRNEIEPKLLEAFDDRDYAIWVTEDKADSLKTPVPHNDNAVVVFGGQEMAMAMRPQDKAVDVIEKYNQEIKGQQRRTLGEIDIKPNKDGQRTIHILETANESTFMHEMAHMFLFDLEELAQIDDVSAKELEIVNEWAAWKKGAAQEYKGTDWYELFKASEDSIINAENAGDFDTADKLKAEWRQERFARGFEMYMKEGTAPAKGLKAIFRKFKSFLRAIYIKFKSDGGKPTEAVRRVMDRMIASEEEIDAAALEDRYNDTVQAGGEKLFGEKFNETLKRWHEEEREEAKEKVLKLVMKDLEKERQQEFKNRMDDERERYINELQQENIFLARKVLAETKKKENVTIFFDTVEEFDALNKITPNMDTLVDEHMQEYGEKLDNEMMESHLSKENIDKAMESSKYRVKIEEYIAKGMERKKKLVNKINAKARAAMDSIEDKLDALPEDVDIQLEKNDNPTIKAIMKEINKLRFADKWSAADIDHIESMLKASTQADVRKAIKDLKAKQAAQKQDMEDIESATKGMGQFYNDLVQKITAEKPMSETCNINYYKDKEREAGRRVKTMYKAGNIDGAINQQRQKVFYAAMVKQARENKEIRDKLLKDLQKKVGAKTVRLPKDERYWFNHLLYLMRVTNTDIKVPEGGVADLGDVFKEQQACLDIFFVPEMLTRIARGGENFGDYNKLSLNEFRSAYEDLKRLYTVGRDKFNFKTIGGISIEEAVKEIMNDSTANGAIATIVRKINPDVGGLNYIDSLGQMGETGDKLAKGWQQYQNSGLKVENILKLLGEKAHTYIYKTLEKAAEKEAQLTEKNLRTLQAINSVFTHEERQARSEKIYDFSSEKGEKISKENIYAMALNWGTEQNIQRLCGGLIEDGKLVGSESEEEVRKEILELFEKTMTEKDWKFIQALWDHVGSFFAETAAVEETLNGVALGRVPNKPFEIKTADGKTIQLKGGYMHIKYNFEKSARAEEMEMEDALRSMSAGATRFGVGRGMTKSRNENSLYYPLVLDFSVIENHLQDVIHNISFRVPLRDVYRLLHYKNNKTGVSLEEHCRRTLGVAVYREIDNWTLDAWKTVIDERNTAAGAINTLFRMWRTSSVFNVMAFRIWPVIENLSNVAVVADKLGAINTMLAVKDFYRHGPENLNFVRQMSAFMRTRMENLDRDLRSQPGTFHAGNKYVDFIKEHGYDFLMWTDLMCSGPTWLKAYNDSFQGKVEEVKAENDKNIQKRLDIAAKVDSIKAAITEEENAAREIDAHLHVRRYGTPAEIEALRETAHAGLGDDELRAYWGEHKKAAKEQERELFKAEQELEQAMKLPVYDNFEILEEAKNRAVFAADSAIRDTFGSARNIDLPSVQRSKNELVRLFTAFYGFFNTQYNALYMSYMQSKYSDVNGVAKWAPFARTAFYRVALASFIGSVLAFGLGVQGDSKDDKEETVMGPDGKKTKVEVPALERFLKVWAKNAFSISTGGLYGVRDVAQVIGDMAFTGNNFGFKMGSVATRSITEGIKAVQLFAKKDEKDEEIKAKQEKKEREHEEKLKKLKGKKRKEYLAKWEEDQKYEKPPKRITYPEILGHAAKSAGGILGAKYGVTSTMTNAVTGTMEYLLDKDMRYDTTFRNIIWSALFDKRPVEREIPKKPPTEPKKKKKKGSKQNEL